MNARLVHRGPNDGGVHIDNDAGVGIGARRLSIIDVAGGHQPVRNEDGTIHAVLNGEIYNHPRLQELLSQRGHRLASRSDTEVLVHLYEEYGDAMVHALEGMFAFAIWDGPKRRLLIARDRFGEKPLFFTQRGDELLFASEVTALAAGVGGRLELEPGALDDFILLGYVSGDRTTVSGVRQLRPGQMLTWSRGDPVARLREYWRPPPRPMESDRSHQQLADELDDLLRTATRSRLIADVPTGVFLSGGLDSTLVTALAIAEQSGPVRTFTVAYDVGSVGEGVRAGIVARHLGTEHEEIVLEQHEIAERIGRVLSVLDQPSGDAALVALNVLAEFARTRITVALGGEGADEIFGGYPRYRWLQRSSWAVGRIPVELRGQARRLLTDPRRGPAATRMVDLLGVRDISELHLEWVTERRLSDRSALYGPRLQAVASDRVLLDVREVVGSRPTVDTASRFMELDRCRWLPDNVLYKADRATMLCSLEMRTPFLSREVAEFAASVPTSVHLRGGGKSLLRELLGRMHPELARGRKTAFRVPQADWLRGPLRELVDHHARDGRLVTEGWIDGRKMRAAVADHARGVDRSATLWPALSLGLWLEGAGLAFSAP